MLNRQFQMQLSRLPRPIYADCTHYLDVAIVSTDGLWLVLDRQYCLATLTGHANVINKELESSQSALPAVWSPVVNPVIFR